MRQNNPSALTLSRVFQRGLVDELKSLSHDKWDMFLLFVMPVLVIVLFAAMFSQSVMRDVPIAVVDNDGSVFSRHLTQMLDASPSLKVAHVGQDVGQAQAAIRRGEVWALVVVPRHTERDMLAIKGAQIVSYSNQSFYTLGSQASSSIHTVLQAAIQEALIKQAHARGLLETHLPPPQIKAVALYNPQLSYELYLEPLLVPAVLHLILCCLLVVRVGRLRLEMQKNAAHLSIMHRLAWLGAVFTPTLAVMLCYTLAWLFYSVWLRGWSFAGSWSVLLLALALFYLAYAFIAAAAMMALKEVVTALSAMALYAGSSLSFADVTLPLADASTFARAWSEALPYTAYARVQTEQWLMGAPASASAPHLLKLLGFCVLMLLLCAWLLRGKGYRENGAAA